MYTGYLLEWTPRQSVSFKQTLIFTLWQETLQKFKGFSESIVGEITVNPHMNSRASAEVTFGRGDLSVWSPWGLYRGLRAFYF